MIHVMYFHLIRVLIFQIKISHFDYFVISVLKVTLIEIKEFLNLYIGWSLMKVDFDYFYFEF